MCRDGVGEVKIFLKSKTRHERSVFEEEQSSWGWVKWGNVAQRVGKPPSSSILKGSQVGEGRSRLESVAGGFRV